MINSTAVIKQKLDKGGPIFFTQDSVRTRSSKCPYRGWLAHEEFGQSFTLTKPGIYKINYNANISSSNASEAQLVLLVDDAPLKGSLTENPTPAISGNVSATSLVRVYPCEKVQLSLNNASEGDLTVKNANIIIEKIA